MEYVFLLKGRWVVHDDTINSQRITSVCIILCVRCVEAGKGIHPLFMNIVDTIQDFSLSLTLSEVVMLSC